MSSPRYRPARRFRKGDVVRRHDAQIFVIGASGRHARHRPDGSLELLGPWRARAESSLGRIEEIRAGMARLTLFRLHHLGELDVPIDELVLIRPAEAGDSGDGEDLGGDSGAAAPPA